MEPTAQAFLELSIFHRVPERTTWMGVPVHKSPLDLWVYQEIIWEVRPAVIIETGTWRGGSALFFAHLLDLLGAGEVLTIDTAPRGDLPDHPRLHYLIGSSVAKEIISQVEGMVSGKSPILVSLDSDHTCGHVRAELEAYAPLVTPASYLVCEDTSISPTVFPGFLPGPAAAVRDFLAEHPEFEADPTREKFLATWNPGGWLRRRT